VELVGKEDPGTTGNFEVTLPNGALIHSKTTMGMGRCQTAEETQAVIDAIQAFIDEQ